jgi:hypothetical protein
MVVIVCYVMKIRKIYQHLTIYNNYTCLPKKQT